MLVVIRGGGDLATGTALRLYRAKMQVVICETASPTSIRRTVCFSEAVRLGETVVEVTQIGKECHSDCAIMRAVGKCVMPTEGIFAVVVKEGTIRAGDEIEVLL